MGSVYAKQVQGLSLIFVFCLEPKNTVIVKDILYMRFLTGGGCEKHIQVSYPNSGESYYSRGSFPVSGTG